jgi:hypothetical protein
MDVFTTKLGTNKGKPRSRIWIEGNRLNAAGFERGVEYKRTWADNRLTLTILDADAMPRAADRKYKVAGKGDHPIIDTTGQRVVDTFGKEPTVDVLYTFGQIIIQGAA